MSEQQKALQEQGATTVLEVQLSCGIAPELDRAIKLLKQLAELSPERVELFLHGLDRIVELVRFDAEDLPAAGARQIRILAKPSDRFSDFLAAAGALKGNEAAIDV